MLRYSPGIKRALEILPAAVIPRSPTDALVWESWSLPADEYGQAEEAWAK